MPPCLDGIRDVRLYARHIGEIAQDRTHRARIRVRATTSTSSRREAVYDQAGVTRTLSMTNPAPRDCAERYTETDIARLEGVDLTDLAVIDKLREAYRHNDPRRARHVRRIPPRRQQVHVRHRRRSRTLGGRGRRGDQVEPEGLHDPGETPLRDGGARTQTPTRRSARADGALDTGASCSSSRRACRLGQSRRSLARRSAHFTGAAASSQSVRFAGSRRFRTMSTSTAGAPTLRRCSATPCPRSWPRCSHARSVARFWAIKTIRARSRCSRPRGPRPPTLSMSRRFLRATATSLESTQTILAKAGFRDGAERALPRRAVTGTTHCCALRSGAPPPRPIPPCGSSAPRCAASVPRSTVVEAHPPRATLPPTSASYRSSAIGSL